MAYERLKQEIRERFPQDAGAAIEGIDYIDSLWPEGAAEAHFESVFQAALKKLRLAHLQRQLSGARDMGHMAALAKEIRDIEEAR